MNDTWFIPLRNFTIFFATLMLVKYYTFLMISPFHTVKEEWRKLRIKRFRKANPQPVFNPKVSVIVPAWNEEVGLLKTVKSVMNNTYDNIEIVVVNDGSTDGSDKMMTKFVSKPTWKKTKPNLDIIYFYKPNGGKGTALNYGIQASTGEIILTIDADSAVNPHAISRLVGYFEDPSIDAVVGNVKVAQNKSLLSLLQYLEYLFGFYYKRAHSVLGAEYIFGGACAAFRRASTFGKIGLFDEANKTEDIEMSLRTCYHGLNCVYAEDVICYTEGAASVLGLLNQRLRWKKGRFDTFIKYRRMFFSLDERHNKALGWFILPYSMLSELQLFFEPIGITLLVSYSIISGDFLSLALGILFVWVIYLVLGLFNGQKVNWGVLLLFPFTWALFYVLVWIEYMALIKSFLMLLRGDDITWQKWERKGIGV
jgi:poly-beta-1,6-N-acetyl-D-glucosamine synthase